MSNARDPRILPPSVGAALHAKDKPPPRKRKYAATVSASSFDRTRKEIREMIASGDFDGMEPRHFVALYDERHQAIYGYAPVEFNDAKKRFNATMMAKRMFEQEFGKDVAAFYGFMKWLWDAEPARIEWCVAKGYTPKVTAYEQFDVSGKFYSRYRSQMAADVQRKRAAGRGDA